MFGEKRKRERERELLNHFTLDARTIWGINFIYISNAPSYHLRVRSWSLDFEILMIERDFCFFCWSEIYIKMREQQEIFKPQRKSGKLKWIRRSVGKFYTRFRIRLENLFLIFLEFFSANFFWDNKLSFTKLFNLFKIYLGIFSNFFNFRRFF